ncbi:hypothetical protein BC937DRAFT_92353 [Endogone sp. FLAS-F59071]|nr:hypothetical protein BC937DRAFT_92353 [Endogone sp. FLAS-F59071]|eukprot:RUS15520.1 hypothetical protein BC937DRAFT_92353 [Endogone sp. FLAS-F59071]
MQDIEDLKPCVALFGPCSIKDLQPGQTKLWCRCGLSKKQPWCDGSHTGTGIQPLKWIVPGTLIDGKDQTLYSICGCKYTKTPPYCDATHNDIPVAYFRAQESCTVDHSSVEKLCTKCGWVPQLS